MSRVVINVSGTIFEFDKGVLSDKPFDRLPQMVLYAMKSGLALEFFVDRSAPCFAAILNYYQSGDLHLPTGICAQAFRRELEFWEIPQNALSECCRYKFISFLIEEAVRQNIINALPISDNTVPCEVGSVQAFRSRIWRVVGNTTKTTASKVYFGLVVCMILLQILALNCVTDETFRRPLSKCELLEYLAHTDHEDVERVRDILGNPNCSSSAKFHDWRSFDIDDYDWLRPTDDGDISQNSSNKDTSKAGYRAALRSFEEDRPQQNTTQTTDQKAKVQKYSGGTTHSDTNMSHIVQPGFYWGTGTPANTNDSYTPPSDNSGNVTLAPANGSTTQKVLVSVTPKSPSVTEEQSPSTGTSVVTSSFATSTLPTGATHSRSGTTSSGISSTDSDSTVTTQVASSSTVDNEPGKTGAVVSEPDQILIPRLTVPYRFFSIIDTILLAFFIVDLCLRCFACPTPKLYFTSVVCVVDLITIACALTFHMVVHIERQHFYLKATWPHMIHYCQVLRILRLFLAVTNTMTYRLIAYAMRHCFRELAFFALLVISLLSIFAGCFFFSDNDDLIHSMPSAWYWSIVTMTTVGYGGSSPRIGVAGLVTCICAFCGILVLLLSITVCVQLVASLSQVMRVQDMVNKTTRPFDSGQTTPVLPVRPPLRQTLHYTEEAPCKKPIIDDKHQAASLPRKRTNAVSPMAHSSHTPTTVSPMAQTSMHANGDLFIEEGDAMLADGQSLGTTDIESRGSTSRNDAGKSGCSLGAESEGSAGSGVLLVKTQMQHPV